MKIERKTLTYIIIATILVFAFMMGLIVNCVQKNKKPTTIQPSSTKIVTETNLSTTFNGKIFFPYLDKNNLIDYLGDEGIVFYRYNYADQKTSRIWSDEILGVQKAVFSPNGRYAIIEVNYPNFKNLFFDFQDHKTSELDTRIRNVVFTPDSQKIVYYYYDENASIMDINIADPNGSNWQKVADITLYDPDIAISPDGKKLALSQPISNFGKNNIYLLDLTNNKISQFTTDGYSSNPIWSPDGTKIVYQLLDSKTSKPTLWIANNDGSQMKSLKIPAFANKIAWVDNKNFIVAYDPNMADNYLSEPAYTLDAKYNFWTYNLDTQTATQLKTSVSYLEVDNLMYNAQNQTLYFTSQDVLYKMEIK